MFNKSQSWVPLGGTYLTWESWLVFLVFSCDSCKKLRDARTSSCHTEWQKSSCLSSGGGSPLIRTQVALPEQSGFRMPAEARKFYPYHLFRSWNQRNLLFSEYRELDSSWNVMAHGDAWEGKWSGNWWTQWVASTLHTTSEHVASSIRIQLKCDGTRWRTAEEVKGKLANAVGSQYSSHYLGTRCIEHYYRWWCTPRLPAVDWSDAPTGRFKWTRPFRRNTISGFCACAITFQLLLGPTDSSNKQRLKTSNISSGM